MKKGREKIFSTAGGIVSLWTRHQDGKFFILIKPPGEEQKFCEVASQEIGTQRV